jgi:hypothetical protein
VQAIGWV